MTLYRIIDRLGAKILPLIRSAVSSKERKLACIGVILAAFWALTSRKSRHSSSAPRVKKAHVNLKFLGRLMRLLKVVIPSIKSQQIFILILLTVCLVLRTMLSISIASVNGQIVRSIVAQQYTSFLKRVIHNQIINLALFAIPASLINSGLDYLNKSLALKFRQKLSLRLNQKYLEQNVYYVMTNLDSRIPNPDQRLTEDIEKWASCCSNLYSNISKPLLDIFLFSKKLAELVGIEGPLVIILWYFLSGFVIKMISPSFGKLTAEEQEKEGAYRSCQQDMITFSEQIAFFNGGQWEVKRVQKSLQNLIKHINSVIFKRFLMGTFDALLVKYGATMVAYGVLALAVFGRGKEGYLAQVGTDSAAITRDYIRNSSLLINLARAIGRLVVSYKELQNLAGYTSLIDKVDRVLDELKQGQYERQMVEKSQYSLAVKGELLKGYDFIRFENVPIVTPNGDQLINSLNLCIEKGMHTFIKGPNGCGKSSIFRILGELWPLFGGRLYKPYQEDLFYIPQKPYLGHGTLRDQIIYPHSVEEMKEKGKTDQDLIELLNVVYLPDVIQRYGLDSVANWNKAFSGGEQQKVAMCRMLYHTPKFAILDQCTSNVAFDIQESIYNSYKEAGITLLTISHRASLVPFHDYMLEMDGVGSWDFYKLNNQMFWGQDGVEE